MRYTKRTKNAGISKKDFAILSAIHALGRSKVSPLAECLGLPRTSVSYRLSKMSERGLTVKEKIGGHFEWTLGDYADNILVGGSKEMDFRITRYLSPKEVKGVFSQLLKDKSEERIYFIEPYAQVEGLISSQWQRSLSSIATLFRKHRNISEGVVSEKNIAILKKYNTVTLEKMAGRMTIIHTIPDTYLQFEDMYIVYKNFTYIFNLKKRFVVEIQSVSFAESIKAMILALREFGKKIDLNKYIQDILNKRIASTND